MKIRTLIHLTKQTIMTMWKNASIISLVIISSCMFMLGMFMLFSSNLSNAGNTFKDQLQVNVFLKDDITDEDTNALQTALEALEDVETVYYVSKEVAKNRMITKDEVFGKVLEIFDHNPLPASYEVTFASIDKIPVVAEEIINYAGVEDVDYGETIVKELTGIMKATRWLTLLIGIISIFAISMIVGNTIRLTIYSRRKEIEIMKLVGATDSFIQVPFVIEGMILGLFGSLISAIVLLIAYRNVLKWVQINLPFMPLVSSVWTLTGIILLIIVVGVLVGAGSSVLSTRKHLKV